MRYYDYVLRGVLVITVVGMFYSRSVPAIGIFLLFVWSLLRPADGERGFGGLRGFGAVWEALKRYPAFGWMTLLFWVPFVSGLWSDDLATWWNFVRIKLPFLALPVAFSVLPWRVSMAKVVWWALVLGALSTVPLVLWENGWGSSKILDAIGRGKAMWTPVNHIRYSLLIAYAALMSWYLAWTARSGTVRWMGIVSGLVLTVFLHYLAVRSGIAFFYAVAVGVLLYEMVRGKYRWPAIGILLCMIVVIVVAVQQIPSLHKRWAYMRWEIEQLQKGRHPQGSDSQRLLSIQAGWEIFQKHPILGVGIGDVQREIVHYFSEHPLEGSKKWLLPHNQYIFTLMTVGLIGFGIFVGVWLYLFLHRSAWRYFPSASIQGGMLLSGLVEHPFEVSLGVMMYTFFTLVALRTHYFIQTRGIQ